MATSRAPLPEAPLLEERGAGPWEASGMADSGPFLLCEWRNACLSTVSCIARVCKGRRRLQCGGRHAWGALQQDPGTDGSKIVSVLFWFDDKPRLGRPVGILDQSVSPSVSRTTEPATPPLHVSPPSIGLPPRRTGSRGRARLPL